MEKSNFKGHIEEYFEAAEKGKEERLTHEEIQNLSNNEKLAYMRLLKQAYTSMKEDDKKLVLSPDEMMIEEVVQSIRENYGESYEAIRSKMEADSMGYGARHFVLPYSYFERDFLYYLFYFMFPGLKPKSISKDTIIQRLNKWIEASFSVAGNVCVIDDNTNIVLFYTPPIIAAGSEKDKLMNRLGESILYTTQEFNRSYRTDPIRAHTQFERNTQVITNYILDKTKKNSFLKPQITWEDIFELCMGEDKDGVKLIEHYRKWVFGRANMENNKRGRKLDTETEENKKEEIKTTVDLDEYDL